MSRLGYVLAMACSAACAPKERPRFPPYAVGSAQYTFKDTTRGTPANGSAAALPYRQLVTDVWYPATADPSAAETPGAPLNTKGAPFPLVLFVHGSSGFSRQSTFLTQAIASRGYVVAAANFPLTALDTPGGPSDASCNMQVQDLSFLADQLASVSGTAGDPLQDAVDSSAGYAVVGHSTGGSVSLDAAYTLGANDFRVKAVVALAPCACFFAQDFFTTRKVPLLVMAGTDDAFVPPSDNGVRAYNLATKSPRWLGTIVGGTHLYFTDLPLADGNPTPTGSDDVIAQAFSTDGGGNACSPVPPIGTDPTLPFALQHSFTIALAEGFLDKWIYLDSSGLDAFTASHDAHLQLESAGH